jgi:hypothetical protein
LKTELTEKIKWESYSGCGKGQKNMKEHDTLWTLMMVVLAVG